MVGYVAVDIYWGGCGRVFTGDSVVDYGAVDLYCSTGYGLVGMALYIFTGSGRVGYVAVDLYLVRCGREWGDRSLLGTEW